MKKIPRDGHIITRKGSVVLIDKEDYPSVSKYTWTTNKTGYVQRYFRDSVTKKMGSISLSRFLMGVSDKMWQEVMVDHINGDKLDNRRSNLRLANNTENQWNSKKSTRNKSGYKGVLWHKLHKKWMVSIQRDCVGYYDDLEVAAWFYNKHAKERFGDFARLNTFDDKMAVEKKVKYLIENPPLKKSNTSGYEHVSYCKREKRFRAYCMVNGKYKSLGHHDTAKQAYEKYKQFSCSLQAQADR